jgi:hypothetical protein
MVGDHTPCIALRIYDQLIQEIMLTWQLNNTIVVIWQQGNLPSHVVHLLCSESLEAVCTQPVSTGALERSSEQVVVTVHALQFCHCTSDRNCSQLDLSAWS